MVDADSLLDPDALLHVSRPFADDPDQVVAAGGVIRVANGSTVAEGRVTDVRMPRTWLARVQVVEYLRAFMIGRAGWSATGALLIISGAFGIFRKDVLATVGGMATDCIGEDAELVVRIYRWLGEERHRRQGRLRLRAGRLDRGARGPRGPAQAAAPLAPRPRRDPARHRGMLFRPKYGVIGMVAMPWFVVFELLAPFLEIFGLAYFLVVLVLLVGESIGWLPWDLVDGWFVLLLLTASIFYSFLLTMVALLAEEMSYRRYRGVGDLLRRGVGRGGGELRLPPAQRLVADGRRHRGDAEGPARLGRHAAQGLRHQAMMGRTVGQRVARVIATSAVLVLLVGSVGVIGLLVTTRSVDNLVDHIEPARQANDGVLQDLTDADAGIRGWAISGDQAALVPFFAAMDELPGHQGDLERYERTRRRGSTGCWRTRTRRSTPGSRAYVNPRLDAGPGPENYDPALFLPGDARSRPIRDGQRPRSTGSWRPPPRTPARPARGPGTSRWR